MIQHSIEEAATGYIADVLATLPDEHMSRNPHVPTVHMNVRFFRALAPTPAEQDVWWFGGGMDLTPYYGEEEDARHFHQVCFDALAPFGPEHYPTMKAWCDAVSPCA